MYWWPGHSPKPYNKNQNKRGNLQSHEHTEFPRLVRCTTISLKSTLIGCKITGFENGYVCIIRTQFLWGQGSSVVTNKHSNSCSPPNSHLVHINQMEGNGMWVYQSMLAKKKREEEAIGSSSSCLSFQWNKKGGGKGCCSLDSWTSW